MSEEMPKRKGGWPKGKPKAVKMNNCTGTGTKRRKELREMSAVPAGTYIYTGTDLTDEKAEFIARRAITKVIKKSQKSPTEIGLGQREQVIRITKETLKWFGRKAVTTNEECMERISDFFATCIDTGEHISVEKLALCLGVTRATLNNWKDKEVMGAERAAIIRMAYETIAAIDAAMVTDGKTPPVPYIFRSKNYYGLTDEQKVVVAPENPLATRTAEELRERIAEKSIMDEDGDVK